MNLNKFVPKILSAFFFCISIACAEWNRELTPFLELHCYDCHRDGVKKGGLAMDQLSFDLGDPATFVSWERIYDRAMSGEMPPKKTLERPSAEELAFFSKHLASPLACRHIIQYLSIQVITITHISTNRSLARRSILKGSGIALALPFLDTMSPVFGKGSTQTISPKRFVALNAALGFHGPNLFPEKEGRDYSSTPYLKILEDFRSDFTLFSGLSHSNQQGNSGHASEMTWLTGVERPGLAGFKNTISIDQVIARKMGASTRFPSLNLGTGGGGQSISWDANGVSIPCQASPSKIYRELFVQGTEKEVEQQVNNLDRGKSILDVVLGDAKSLRSNLGCRDKEKLDQYFSSVRELEVRLEQNKEWARKPKPDVSYEEPKDVQDRYDLLSRQRLMYDLMTLALKTDSTRVITFSLGAFNAVPTNIDGVKTDWHNLSHHGKDENKIEELEIVEKEEFSLFAKFLGDLKNHQENGSSLLTNTAVLFGSNLGNASSHDWRNLPIILAGGGYRHGCYVAHDPQNNTPLSNLFVPLAQRMGVAIEQFGKSTKSSLRGLES